MTPTYTPDDIELWRELRVAFDLYVKPFRLTPYLCSISLSFEWAWYVHRVALKELVLEFLKAYPELPVQPGNNFLFAPGVISTQLATQTRSRFIDWNIERLSVKVETRPDNEETRAEDAKVEQQHAEEVAED